MVRNHDCLPPPMPERTRLAPRRRGSGHPPISNLGLCLRTLALGHELITLPDGSVPDGDQLFLVEYPLAFACLRYFNAFEWGTSGIFEAVRHTSGRTFGRRRVCFASHYEQADE